MVGIANLRIGAIALALALCLIPTVAPANPEITVNLPSNSSMRFVRIEPGSFLMGTSEKHRQQMDKMAFRGDGGFIHTLHSEKEIPQHRVTLTKGFFLGKYEVTREQWLAVMGAKAEKESEKWRDFPEEWQGVRRPATKVSWLRIQEFMAALGEFGGGTFRLPTEAEWEYAARAGTETLWVWGDDGREEWKYKCEFTLECDVGSDPLFGNSWGLFDMQGNVSELVLDGAYRKYSSEEVVDPVGPSALLIGEAILRGGDSGNPGGPDPVLENAYGSRSAARIGWGIEREGDFWVGFRVLLELEEDPTSVDIRGWGAVKKLQRSE